MSRAQCRDVTLPNGETIRVRGDKPPTQADLDALTDIVDAVRRQHEALPAEQREAMARRQRAALDRIHGRTRDVRGPVTPHTDATGAP